MRPPRKRRRADPAAAVDPAAAETAAIGLLARRDFSVLELRKRLSTKGYSEEAIEVALGELRSSGALDDGRFAHNYASLHAGRGEGPVRIAAELRNAGISDALIQSALADLADWSTSARALRARRFGSKAPRTWPERARQARFLQYRGFASDQIRAALGSDLDIEDVHETD